MAFAIKSDINDRPSKVLTMTSATYTVGQLVELVNGTTSWAACTSSSNYFTRKAITQAAGTTVTSLLCTELDGTETIEAAVTATASANHNGDLMVLTDSNTVNNTGTVSSAQTACFVQDDISGSLIIGRVIVGKGVDPDAT